MTGATPPGARSTTPSRGSTPPPVHGSSSGHGHDARDQWPRDFGRDGVSGLVGADRAMRARDVSRPDADDERAAEEILAELLARVDGRRPPGPRPRS